MFPKKHQCQDSNLFCFDCKSKICRECMVVMPKSMVCMRCANAITNKAAKTQVPEKVMSRVTIHGASALYSFVAFAVLSVFSGCVS